jgi:cellulose synthase/poly-beta-1,6-N-acetylglucosamine synthase-like glycosyltransferase
VHSGLLDEDAAFAPRSRDRWRFAEFRSVVDSFKQALAWGETLERSQDGQDPSRERREAARTAGERGGEIAPEIAFLVGQGVGPGPLLQAMRAAERCAVSADAALLGEGLLPEEAYFRALARRLRVPYFSGELAIADDIDPASAIASGIAPLAPNGLGLRAVVAPRGDSIRFLIDAAAAGHALGGFAVSSPQRLSALVRAKTGARVAEAAACGLERRDSSLSAHSGLSWGQVACIAALAIAAATLALAAPGALRPAVSIPLWLIFAAWIVIRNLAVAAAFAPPAFAPLADQDLPVYSVVAALYREAGMVKKLIRALDAIDYPRAKLDIKLVVERRDGDTLAAIAALGLPARYDVIVAPAGKPSTKPRALNVALPALRGDFVVVYDAEDEPDPDQLRLAAAHFVGDPGLDCLQARLTIGNVRDSWISKMFAIEYAALFDLVDPGLAALGLPIALGGTSNHFRARTLRRVGGWDAWNVTEDADIGVRLAREGARVGSLCSDTLEEAPNDLGAWFRQRIRWQKGWMQTLIVHSRHPVRVVRALGPARALAAVALIGGSVLGGLFGPALFVEALWRAFRGDLAGASAWSVSGDVAIYALMATGLMAIFIPALAATRRRGMAGVGGALASLPLYCALISVASWAALVDLTIRPFHWAKTEHGRAGAAAGAGVGAPGPRRAAPGAGG